MDEIRILAFAYACEPDRGSEPEAGWLWARILAEIGPTTVITRTNNRESIEAKLSDIPEQVRPRFHFVDLSPRVLRWKRGRWGIRLYYIAWQLKALRTARELLKNHDIDLVWHLTLANAWLGSAAGFLGRPFVFGPVGGGPGIPWRYLHVLGWRGWVFELARGGVRQMFRFLNPLMYAARSQANVILVQNRETLKLLGRKAQAKSRILPHAVIEVNHATGGGDTRHAVFAGRLEAWKGAGLAARVMISVPHWKLTVVGRGPARNQLAAFIERSGLQDRVTLVDWLPRAELHALFRQCSVLLFPSLHDDSPFVVAEAIGNGLPVLCLDRGGPAVIAGPACVSLPYRNGPKKVIQGLARVLEESTLPSSSVVRERANELSLADRVEKARAIAVTAIAARHPHKYS